MPLSQMLIMKKAKIIFNNKVEMNLKILQLALKKRANIHNIRISDEAASSNVKAAQEFPEQDVQESLIRVS
ncbi:hypothetical protein T10_12241 [Trichinella papuae]|uniref:Uncharacterized protein n=1 Tax=Trichinella papuae TaxID=268474 RepID=A0A0V1MWQ1_9BILA|nr:hypothetical protein T10_12241 [Trichinella papuae]